MAPPKGSKFWMIRRTHGRKPIFANPEQMWEDCCAYFQWVEDNPLQEMKAFHFQGQVIQEPVEKMRAMTLNGLCVFLGISDETWREYRKKDSFSGVINEIEKIIYDQKFTGAAADLLNANIIARDLGLADKKDHQSTDASMTPKETVIINGKMDPSEATQMYQDMLNGKA